MYYSRTALLKRKTDEEPRICRSDFYINSMYTDQNIEDSLSSDRISMMLRSKLIFCLDENKNTAKQMTDMLIYLSQEYHLMFEQQLETLREHDFYFIRTAEQIEYKTFLTRRQQSNVIDKLNTLHLIDSDNKCLFQHNRFRVNFSKIAELLNNNEEAFREREHQHQLILDKSKENRHRQKEMKNKKTELFRQINKMKYEDYSTLESFMTEHNYTIIDSCIICLISKLYVKYQHKEFYFKEVDLNTIRKYVTNVSRKEEMSDEPKYVKFDARRIIEACKDTSKSFLTRDTCETLTFVDRYLSQKETAIFFRDYEFENDEDYQYLLNKVPEKTIDFYLNEF